MLVTNEEKQKTKPQLSQEEKMRKRERLRTFAVILIIIGFFIFLFAAPNAFEGGKDTSGWLLVLMPAVFLVIIGFSILHNYPDNGQNGPLQKPVKPSKADITLSQQIKAANSLSPDMRADVIKSMSDDYLPNLQSEWQKQKTTKEMVKGAVVGGIIGGDAGAVVGAMIGKENSEK